MKSPIYINLHIPKTAGYTLRYHITKNLKSDEHLLIDYPGMDLFNPPLNYEVYKKAAFKLIKSLSKEKRDRIKVIHGHTVPYGIHELFDRDARYFTFVRNPVYRTVSIYNHLSYLNTVEGHLKRMHPYYEKYLLVNSVDPGFKEWLKIKYKSDIEYQHFSTVGYLKEFGYLEGEINKLSVRVALKKFYFLGLTENYSDEILYFFKELDMHKYFIDQNISHKRQLKIESNTLINRIVRRNEMDQLLFTEALTLNHNFKLNHPEFQKAIEKKKIERNLLLPFTQVLFAPRQTAIRLFKSVFVSEPISHAKYGL